MKYWQLQLIICLYLLHLPTAQENITEIDRYLAEANRLLAHAFNDEAITSFNFGTNVTIENGELMNEAASKSARLKTQLKENIKRLDSDKINDTLLKRQIEKFLEPSIEILNAEDYQRYQDLKTIMQTNYAKVKVCHFEQRQNCTLTLEPNVEERFSNSRNPEELSWYWQQWYNKAGTPVRQSFAEYVKLLQKAAQLSNLTSAADFFLSDFEDPEVEQNIDRIYAEILPFYRQIHGYVRHRLHQHYGAEIVPKYGNIPMHLLGNVYAQTWNNILDLVIPYKQVQSNAFAINAEMQRQNYTALHIFQMAEEFFRSLGMRALPQSFWNLSMFTRPKDTKIEVQCHASAHDFYTNTSDVRIKMCTEVNLDYLNTVHHEMGHIYYYLEYEKQPTILRASANFGFHEAIGDAIEASVASMKHLQKIGLIRGQGVEPAESRINRLFRIALSKIIFLPFGYFLEKYRFAIFRNQINASALNTEFWRMRANLTGVQPPILRTENDFDVTAKFHICSDVGYIRYFAAHIYEYQFYKRLCILAGQYKMEDGVQDLDNCDFYGNRKAGAAFSKFMSLGASKHWKIALEEFTGDSEMNAAAILEYFEPLHVWLKEENKRLNVPLGW